MAARNAGSQWPEWMKPGVRVVRGPDWRATIRDPKSVDLGTLSYVPKNAADNRVQVVWDTGQERSYQSGFSGQYELRAYDTQQVGIKHTCTKCSECSMKPLRGVRYNCPTCNTDLCVECYSNDKHDLSHAFLRYDTPNSEKVNLPSRKESKYLNLMGVFKKSEVIRGPHWNYTGTDGESGKGIVMAFVEDKGGLANAWVRVKWEIGHDVKEYRFGVNGFVDVVATKVNKGGKVYVDHMPVIGIIKLKPADKVSVNMTLKEFKDLQTKGNVPEGWKDSMKQCIDQLGTVIELLFDGKMARVQYLDGNTHIIVQPALYRVKGFREGDAVDIINDKKILRKLQDGHGGTPKDMEKACGQIGRLIKLNRDGDLEVLVAGKTFTFSPVCCTPVDDPNTASKAPPVPESDSEEEDDTVPEMDMVPGRLVMCKPYDQTRYKTTIKDFSEEFSSLCGNMKRNHDVSSTGSEMFDAFTKADLESVKKIVKQNGTLVDFKMESRTILHLACHEGYKDLVTFLIEAGADINAVDSVGDTPLHYAAFGKQPDCVQELLQNAADPNIQNENGLTALMIAIDHPDVDSVQCLILNNADVSLKSNDGETAMHSAIEQKDGHTVIVTSVLSAATADHSICNSDKFNILQWAAFKDNRAGVKIAIEKSSNLVNVPLEGEGFTALHIAVVNDFVEVASMLLGQGGADPNRKDNEERTPLHLAVSQQHKRSIEILLEKNADVNAKDRAGDTPLHYSQKTKTQKLSASRKAMTWSNDANIAIVYFLLEKGADLHVKNKNGETPTDLIVDPKMKDMIEKLTAAYKKAPAKSQAGVRLPMHWKEMKVTDVEMVELDKSDTMQLQEFNEVEKHFKSSLDQCEIGSVKRIQNALLWEHYTLKKREMEMKHGQGCANEMHLYHGTKPDLIDLIAHDNFDFRIAGSRVGALYGDGSYFATTAKYSDLYASANDKGYKIMFVTKVLTGKYCLGAPGLKRPPEINGMDQRKGCFDSTVNNIFNPTIYCVFDKNQYYPEYLIEYR